MNLDRMVKTLSELIKSADTRKTSGYDTTAKVVRVEDGIAWVHIPGGVDETPVEMTINAAPGDSVQVRVGGGKAWLVGNGSAPPTDDTTAIQAGVVAGHAANVASSALDSADVAHQAAQSAQTSAVRAQISADQAKVSATNANEYASRALTGLSTVQSVAETLTWITQHGTMTLTTDTAIDPSHVYFVLDPNGDYVVGSTHYTLITEPDPDELSSYYELSIDESLNNYVGTHLAVTEDGLWLLPAGQGTYKILIATGAGSTYTTAGTYIIDSTGGAVASFRVDGVTIGEILNGKGRVEVTPSGFRVYRRESGSDIQIANIGYGEATGQDGTSNAPYITLGARMETAYNYSSTKTYHLGDLITYNEKKYVYINSEDSSGHSPDSSDGNKYWVFYRGSYSASIGHETISSGYRSFAEGSGHALNNLCHAEGAGTAVGNISHAEGGGVTIAYGELSHAEGWYTEAHGEASHTQNAFTKALHDYSHAGGFHTQTSKQSQTVIGEYNADNTGALFIVGNGTGSNNRSNAFAVLASGFITGASNALIYRGEATGNADDVTTTGLYYIGGTPLTNGANVKWRHLVVINGGVVTQMILNIGANSAILCRIYSGNPASWSPWYSIT